MRTTKQKRKTKIQDKRATLDLNPEQMAVTVRAAGDKNRIRRRVLALFE